jgi:predicted GIY-YIG superfamily endonuclease
MTGVIYKITNPTGKIYIGQSVNINKRFNSYYSANESLSLSF